MRFKNVTIVGLILALILLAGCGSSDKSYVTDDRATETTEEAQEMPAEADGGSYETGNSNEAADMDLDSQELENGGADLSNRKIIQNKYIFMETLEFDETIINVEVLVNKYFGYVESSQVSGIELNNKSRNNTRWGNYRIRIPADSFNAFVDELVLNGNVLENSDRMQDVTMQYLDLEARIHSLEVQEERLLELLEKGDDLEAILEIENKLADVRYQIETYSATLGNLDNQVKYGTVELDIREVYEETVIEPTPITTGEKIVNGFTRSIKNIKEGFIDFIIWFIAAIPYLIIWGIIVFVIVIVIKKIATSREKKRLERFEQKKLAEKKETENSEVNNNDEKMNNE